MKTKLLLLSFIFIFSLPAFSEKLKSNIPLSVDSIQTHRVADSLIQVIQYNMEFTPKLVIQRLGTPKLKLLQQQVIDKIKIKNKMIDFNHSAGTFIESLALKEGVIIFTIQHYNAGSSGGEITLNCKVDVTNNNISEPTCIEK